MTAAPDLDCEPRHLRARFEATSSFTVGAEEELLLVDPATSMPIPAAPLALELFRGDRRVATEFRAAQVEIVSPVCIAAADVARELAAVRSSLAVEMAPDVALVAIGAHPVATDPGPITDLPRYSAIARSQPWAAAHMMTCGLHVHVAVGGADRALAVHNAIRSFLPEIVALGANAPFYRGADSNLATIRPSLNRALARFGTPPAFGSWEELSAFLTWVRRSGAASDSGCLWWDLRLNLSTATIEVRAADAQTRVTDAAAIVAFVQCLAYQLASRYEDGEVLGVHDQARIDESLFLASRDGVAGQLPDLDSGAVTPTLDRIFELVEQLRPAARALGCLDELNDAICLARDGGGAGRQRAIARSHGVHVLVDQLAGETCNGVRGPADQRSVLATA